MEHDCRDLGGAEMTAEIGLVDAECLRQGAASSLHYVASAIVAVLGVQPDTFLSSRQPDEDTTSSCSTPYILILAIAMLFVIV